MIGSVGVWLGCDEEGCTDGLADGLSVVGARLGGGVVGLDEGDHVILCALQFQPKADTS